MRVCLVHDHRLGDAIAAMGNPHPDRTPDIGRAFNETEPLSAVAAAAALGVHERTIRRAIARGELPAAKRSGVFRIAPEALGLYRERRSLGARSPFSARRLLPHLIPMPAPSPGARAALPKPRSSLIGREAELAEVRAMLLHRDGGLVTLIGPGGVGKTRLALEVAAGVHDAFADGVVFVELAPLRDPALVGAALAAALGVRDTGARSLAEALCVVLRDRNLLLVLDNFEPVVEGAALVAALLAACPRIKVLATSRVRLRLSSEQAAPLAPLRLPDTDGELSVATVSAADAVRLFVARAHAADPAFAFTAANAATVAAICVRLDGLPLAIELAAARVAHLPLPALLARLERRLSFLTGGPRDLPVRLRTMRDAIAWSYDLLDHGDQSLFRRLAVLSGGFDLEAAAVIAGPEGDAAADILDRVVALVDSSLVSRVVSPAGEHDDRPRYRMLETVREFALDRLEASGEGADVRRRHAEWFLDLAERARPVAWLGWIEPVWMARLEREQGNLRAALEWFVAEGPPHDLLRLAIPVAFFWELSGQLRDARGWLERAVLLGYDSPAGCRAAALWRLAYIALWQADETAAREFGERSLVLAREARSARDMAEALVVLGAVAGAGGDWERARALHQEAFALAKHGGDPVGGAFIFNNLGVIANAEGDRGRATVCFEAYLAACRLAGWDHQTHIALGNLAVIAHETGDLRRAAEFDRRALDLAWRLHDLWRMSTYLGHVATVAGAAGRPEQAVWFWGAAEALRERTGAVVLAHERAQYERDLDAIRAGLGEAAFSAAWAAGRRTPIGEVVAAADATLAAVASGVGRQTRSAPGLSHALTPRQVDVLRLVAAGLSNQEIAAALFISLPTVKVHVRAILTKLGLESRTAAAAFAIRHGLA